MAQYSTVNLARNDLISYIVFSCWDNTAGPTPKRLWAGSPIPDHSEIKLLTRLVLKTEVPHRDHKSAHIDCNVYNLADLGVCAVSYLFTGVAKSRIGSRIFCLILVCRAEHRARYMQWSSIIDPVVKQGIAEYKVKLHQDFKSHAPGKTKVLTSNEHLNEMVSKLTSLINRMTLTELSPDNINVKETFFYDERIKTKSKEKHLLEDTISAMLLSFCCVVIVGGEKYTEDVNKWVRTLSLLMSGSHRKLCFRAPGGKQTDIIPNAKVQGILSDEELRKGKSGEFLMTLYTKCTYPVAILDVGRNEVLRTANYKLHQLNYDEIRMKKLTQIFQTTPPGPVDMLTVHKALNSMHEDVIKSDTKSPLLLSFIKQTFEMEPVGRVDYIRQWMTVLQSKALSLIDFLTTTHKPKSGNKEAVYQEEIKKYQMITDDADLELILSVAESLHAGIYEYVKDESSDIKSKALMDII